MIFVLSLIHLGECNAFVYSDTAMIPLVVIALSICAIALYLKRYLKPANKLAHGEDWVAPPITPVEADFVWSEAKPLNWLPFVGKTNFKPSMSVKNMSDNREDLFLVENTHLEGTKRRKENIKTHGKYVCFSNTNARSTMAVREFYLMTLNFLHDRYPMLFDVDKEKDIFVNKISNEVLPYCPDEMDPRNLVELLGGNIEEDFIIMLKDNPDNEEEEYITRASVTGTPAGFDPSLHNNQPVSHIHKPVPQYKERLKSPMARFFNKLKPKDIWVRGNWSFQENNILFKLDSHHGRPGDELKELAVEDLDFENSCYVRAERQVLTRLPKSGAVIMLVRTYLTPVRDVKAQGLGESLANAIDALPEDLAFYKRRQVWGSAVKQYLRS